MPWSETDRMDQRVRFVLEALQGRLTMSELCDRYGVSRKTGYKWVERYHLRGLEGCEDRSRASASHPNAVARAIEAKIVEARRQFPTWGPRKLRSWLTGQEPKIDWPAVSTIGAILKRNDLVSGRRRRPAPKTAWRTDRTYPDRPNRVWTADFKGQFRLGDGTVCFPLTVQDAHSRFLIVCHGLRDTSIQPTRAVFEATFGEYGLPDVIHTDNGIPFSASQGLLGLSMLSVWFLKLGIRLERSRPGKPQDNGRHERMHRTLKAEAVHPPGCDEAAQQDKFDRFRHVFNEERPHEALDQKTPAHLYTRSTRAFPEDLLEPVYPAHFTQRTVSKGGCVGWKKTAVFISEALRHQTLGFEQLGDGQWAVYFADILLGHFTEADRRFVPVAGG